MVADPTRWPRARSARGSRCGSVLSGRSGASSGTCVVHAASPRAMVARRCTCVPSSSAKARVSASHSCGNSAGHVGDRAVVLAELHAPVAAAADLADLRRVPPGGQHPGERGDPVLRRADGPQLRDGRTQQVVDPLGGEPVERLLPRVRGEVAQRGDGQVVVAVPEPGPACVGEQVVPGRAPPTAGAAARRVAHLRLARLDQRVQVPADRGRRQLQLGRHRCRGARPLLHQQPGDGGAGATLGMARLGTGTGGPASAAAPGPRRTGAGSMRGTGPLLFTTPVLPISRRSAKPTPFTAGPGERAHCRTRSLPCGHVAGRAGHPTAGAPCTAGGAAGGRVLDDPRPGADPAPARAHRRPDDGHRRARRRGPARAEPAVRAARHQPARAQRHRRHRDHLRRHGHAGAGLAVDRPHAAGPRSRGPGPGPHPARAHRAAVGAAARAGAADVLQGRLQLPRAERDHCARARPVLARPGRGARRRRPAHPHDPHDLARHARPVRPAVPDAGARHHRADRLRRGRRGCTPTASSPSAAWR